jgi:hypothetical protein
MATAIVSIKPGAGAQDETRADSGRKAMLVWPAPADTDRKAKFGWPAPAGPDTLR